MDTKNLKLEKEAGKLVRKLNKDTLQQEMSLLNDHILAEGVENLESESGRVRFFKNLQFNGLKCTRERLDETLEQMLEDQGREVLESTEPQVIA